MLCGSVWILYLRNVLRSLEIFQSHESQGLRQPIQVHTGKQSICKNSYTEEISLGEIVRFLTSGKQPGTSKLYKCVNHFTCNNDTAI